MARAFRVTPLHQPPPESVMSSYRSTTTVAPILVRS
jgi:hypothetical protein